MIQGLSAANKSILDAILVAEGWPTYTNDPNDRGGPTKGGITQETLARWRGKPVSASDVAALEEKEARAIYWQEFVTAPGFDKIKDDALRTQVVDAGVLHGPERAARWLQQLAGVKEDGRFGPQSQAATNIKNAQVTRLLFGCKRIRFMGAIINENYKARQAGATKRDQSRFAEGWLNRATAFLDSIVGG